MLGKESSGTVFADECLFDNIYSFIINTDAEVFGVALLYMVLQVIGCKEPFGTGVC